MDEFCEEVKEIIADIIADIKVRNLFIRPIMKIEMAPYVVIFLALRKLMDKWEAWMDGR